MLTFPDRLRVSESAFTPVNQSVSGGQAMTGFQQWRTSPRGRWSAKVTCQVVGEEEKLVFDGFVGALQGAGVECLVTPRDGIRPRDAAGIVLPWRTTVAWGNGAMFQNGAGWAAPGRNDAVAVAAPQGSLTLGVRLLNCSGLRPGHYVGAVDRVYRVLQVAPNLNDATVTNCTIWPRLRAGVIDGQPILLAAPVCRMRLKSDDSGALSLRWREQATPTLEFVESYPVPGS